MTGRLPFDPRATRAAREADEAAAAPARGSDEAHPLALGELARRIRGAIDALEGPVWVEGEVSNFSDRGRGHWWFTLKDETGPAPGGGGGARAAFGRASDEVRVDAVAWKSRVAQLDATARDAMHDGARVIARGRLDYYAPQGRLRLVVDRLRPAGLGDLHARFERLKRTLREEGIFEASRKRALPALPARVAVVTSAGAAALQDVRATAARRFPFTRLVLVDVRVQGERAAAEVARALRGLDALAAADDPRAVDAIVLTRGGGSLEDLWAFNEEPVVRAVADCRVPVVAAIGHESDTLLAELAADERASTPTQAVVRLLPDRTELAQQLESEERRLDARIRERLRAGRAVLDRLATRPCLRRPAEALRPVRERLERRTGEFTGAIRAHLAGERHRLAAAAGHLGRLRPARIVGERRERLDAIAARLERAVASGRPRSAVLDGLAGRLDRAARRRTDQARREVRGLAAALDLVDPEHVVRRGFTWTTDASGAVLRSATDARAAGRLVTRFADGRVTSRVEADGADAAETDGDADRGGPARARRRRQSGGDAPSLFDPPADEGGDGR